MFTRYRHMNHEEFLRLAGAEAKSELEVELVNRLHYLLNVMDRLECDLEEAERTLQEEGFEMQERLVQ